MIELGCKAQDTITGFKGVVTGRVEYITGCNQLLLAPQVGGDGGLRDSQWFDEQRVKRLAGKQIVIDNGAHPGPDKAAPKR